MTERSTRRDAELAIINAASTIAADPRQRWRPSLEPLVDAVKRHEELGLAQLSERGATSNNSTDTSAEAAASLGDIAGLARTCFDEIAERGGLTVDQLEQVLNRPHQTVSARVNDLNNKGWIEPSGMKRTTRSGRKAIVWKPTVRALEMQP